MSLIKTAIGRPVTVSMFVVAVALFGVISLDRLALNLLPDISYPSLTVQTAYPDTAPEEVESLITRPIEEAVGVVPGLTRLTSVSRSGQSEVVMEFRWNTQMDLATLDVREKLDFVNLPREAEKPIILRFDPTYDPILRLRLYGDLSAARLRYIAEKELKKALESAQGVAAIKVLGGLEEQIRVEIDEQRLAELGIPITEVTQALDRENLNQAAGSLYDLDSNYMVRLLNQFRSVDEIRDIIIRERQGRKVILGDVAQVWRGTKEREVIARLDGRESVEMAIYKEGDANTVSVSRAVQARLESLQKSGRFPKDVEYKIVFNQAEFIENAVNNVLTAAVMGGVLAILILFVFLRDSRSTVAIGLSIPISILATFALMYQTGVTLNIMSLGGVALGVGMLVDNSIVVLEAVHRRRKSGLPLSEAVYLGTREVGKAVTASTLTTVAVFVPLIFVEGIAGQLFRDQALTITYALLASLLVALTFLPMILAARLKQPVTPATTTPAATASEATSAARLPTRVISALRRFLRFIFSDVVVTVVSDLRRILAAAGRLTLKLLNPLLSRFMTGYEALARVHPRLLNWALDNKTPALTLTLLFVCAAGVLAMRLGAELIPSLSQGEFTFEVRLPEGRSLQQTDRVLTALESQVSQFPEVETIFSSVGGSNRNQFAQNLQEEHVGLLYVVLKERRDPAAEEDVIQRIRAALAEFPEVTYTFGRPTLFSFKTPVEVEAYGYDLHALREASEQIAARLHSVEGLRDINTSTQPGNPEIHVVFDRVRLARLGLEENQISNILRNTIRGDVATRFREEDRRIDILVRAREADRNTVENLRNLVINATTTAGAGSRQDSRGGTNSESATRQAANEQSSNRSDTEGGSRVVPIRLGSVAEIYQDRGPAEIRRIRAQRAAVVSANLTGRDLSSVTDEIRRELADLRGQLPAGTTVAVAGQNDELATSFRSLLFALALAVFLVYLVMASQFESLIHPMIILFTVPLGLVGVVFALWATGTTISVMVFLGIIVLAGIVVNNAIVLIDYTNQLRHEGLPRRQALLQASSVRLRPILMTTLTTVLGLIPMALAWGEGAEVRAPMAITVMGGLIFSTALTLLLIPMVYEIVDRKVFAADVPAAEVDLPSSIPGAEGARP